MTTMPHHRKCLRSRPTGRCGGFFRAIRPALPYWGAAVALVAVYSIVGRLGN